MKLKVRIYGDPMLRKKCQPIEKITKEIRSFVEDMIETMLSIPNAIGLSATQVGSTHRVFVVREEKTREDGLMDFGDPKVYINPKLSNPSEERDIMLEGCLSFPGLHVEVIRPISITVQAMNIDGETFEEKLTGFKARMIMHENDHLNGVLHIDRCDPKTRKTIDPMLRRMKKKYHGK